ncbi:hypothetical protein HYV12_02100 [Candidatus Dojkabacteria bacterium]|nr:hypothetical protein [Candidatus Dojkabacteria bacterium]
MKPKHQQFIFYLVLFLIIFLYFLPEIRLLTKYTLNNGFRSSALVTERIREIKGSTYTVEVPLRNFGNVDLDTSYIELSGSKYLFEVSYENYSYFFDRIVPFTKIFLNDERVRFDSENEVAYITDTHEIPISYSVISEMYIFDTNQNLTYEWEVGTFGKAGFTYWSGRISYLFQLFVWFFAIFGFFKVKRNWTIIYDSATKKPIPGVIVRIYSEGRLVKTTITSVIGFIDVRLNKGKYTIAVAKPGYKFPSNLAPLANDDYYNNLYYGGDVTIERNNSRLKLNIPLDPDGAMVQSSQVNVLLSGALSLFDNASPHMLIVITGVQIVLWPTYIDTWIFTGITLSLFLAKYLIKRSSKSFKGIVRDTGGIPVPNITFNLYDTQWEKFVRSFISDENGTFESIEVPNSYYVKVANPEWKFAGSVGDKFPVKGKQVGAALFINDTIVVEKVVATTPAPVQ